MIRVGLYSQDCSLDPLLSSALGPEFEFLCVSNELELEQLIADKRCDLVLLDLASNQPEIETYLDYGRRLVASEVTLLLLAEDALRAAAAELVRLGAHGYCRRPPSIRDLRIMLRRAYEGSLIKKHIESASNPPEPNREQDEMVGSSAAMQQVHYLIDCVANIEASVLVSGESGTGKELIARAIHHRGTRRNRPFVAVACGAIPETLIEAELFGHEKGAFTGTVGAREGLFEQAADGTLFLDEIGELSPYTQVKLLRVLQQREFSRLGSNRLIPLKARLVFATHRDLSQLVAQGKFRQDLFYRINVMKIEVPSLQERAEDIPQIAMHFLHHYAHTFQKSVHEISADALTMLRNYPWPGNVRELENIIQRAIILAPGRTLRCEDLPATLQSETTSDAAECIPGGSFERRLRDYKIKLAETAIREHNGNKTLAARSLSISRAYLHRLIRLADSGSFSEEEHLESDAEVSRSY